MRQVDGDASASRHRAAAVWLVSSTSAASCDSPMMIVRRRVRGRCG
jgi:hypothetical protein